ncbi:AbrB/MazE/SpoVT family DNA-binding domain-containing protein [Salinarimonas ramus]|uniref:SpoVT-AbrB domain-containing protein n=1 Tax=Salinarimonas ramus TaxID=690164 RepID=A0A917QCX2_9HYPH|nr:AbrB/MazE/SpoVT family DNA-binding domain-containing protein [Salinarimonas ramus]GGK44400.1 hypothetical protein GCM10011322_34480 [Salinarimonas ramus]
MGAVVTSKGQITLPADVRREFGINQGDEIVFFKKLDGSMGVRVRRPRPGAGRGMFKIDRSLTNEEIDEAIGQEVEARYGRTLAQPADTEADSSS